MRLTTNHSSYPATLKSHKIVFNSLKARNSVIAPKNRTVTKLGTCALMFVVSRSTAASYSMSVPPVFPKLPAPPRIHARSAILVDEDTGQILYWHNANWELPMASTTKLMTAILFCEKVSPDTIVTAGEDAATTGQCSMHLKLGEKLTAHDLLRGMLLRSANDAAVAAADAAGGSVPAFVRMMNAEALSLGCYHTHFANPNGLTAPEHYTTARDLSVIARAAMQVARIKDVVRLKEARIHRSIDQNDLVMRNHTHFVGFYKGANGIKTGWTDPAGHCLVGSASRNGWDLISVVLNDRNFAKDTMALMNYGFKYFKPEVITPTDSSAGSTVVSGGKSPHVSLVTDAPVRVIELRSHPLPVHTKVVLDKLSAPVSKGEIAGHEDVYEGNMLIDSVGLSSNSSDLVRNRSKSVFAGLSGLTEKMVIVVGILVSLGYGTRIIKIAKSARRRWSGIAKGM